MTQRTSSGYSSEPPKTVRELGIMMSAQEAVFLEKLSSIEASVRNLSKTMEQISEQKANKTDLDKLSVQIENYHREVPKLRREFSDNYVTQREAKIGAGVLGVVVTIVGLVIDLIVRIGGRP